MKNILVTGAAGFIGSHTCVELLQSGYNVIGMDNYINSKPECIKRIKEITKKDMTFYNVDMLDFQGMSEIFLQNKIDAVIHFAGLKAVGESVNKPFEYYSNNVGGTLELIKVMNKFGCKNMVFSSSATVYGMNNPIPYKEEFPTSATSPYGYTKVMIEQILIDLCKSDKEWSAVLLRYFNPIGAHSSGLIGEDPNGIPNNLFPYIAQVAIGKLEVLSVYGNDYNTVDGTGVRDYVHVVDLAQGHIAALDYGLKNKGVESVNLGTGKGTSVLEIVSAFEKVSGKVIGKKFADRRAGDIDEFYADTTKSKELFNWSAKSGIEKMCEDGWNFTKNNPMGM